MTYSRAFLATAILLNAGLNCVSLPLAAAGDSAAAIIDRVGEDIRYFASDELEGRGIDTDGIHLAADRILQEYRKYGLTPGMPDGTFKQPFEVSVGKMNVTNDTAVVLTNAAGESTRLEPGKQFQALRRGHDGRAVGELVFIGYGITSTEDKYDDFASIDVAGKIVVMLRREPQQGQADGAFAGTRTSTHAFVDRKLKLAKQHNVAGILFVNDLHTAPTPDRDELTSTTGFGTADSGIPFAHVRQTVVDTLLQASPLKVRHSGEIQTLTSLKDVSDFIDTNLVPVSQPLTGWSAEVNTRFNTQSVTTYNLIGVLEGEGPLADQTLVVGAHYDHLGYGGFGSRAKSRVGEIHNGADDNATGTAAVLELIRRVADGPKLKRRVVFICFSGEERGLLGSAYYVKHPVIPLAETVAMLNFDMIGTLRDNRVEVNGVSTAAEFRSIVEAADQASPLDIKVVDNPFGGSDHLPFFRKNIPVMFCFTGITSRYHTPDDDFEAVNVPGVVSVIDLSEYMLRAIVDLPGPPHFQEVSRSGRKTLRIPFLGIVPNLGTDDEEKGVPIQSVRNDSPARKSGLQVGDIILKANDADIDGFSDLIQFIKGRKAGDEVEFSVLRESATLKIKATLAAPK